MGELKPIEDEVRKELDKLKDQPAAPEEGTWTKDDQAQLEAEMADITFNPDHETKIAKDFTDSGREGVHRTANFLIILGIVDNLLTGNEPKTAFDSVYQEQIEPRQYNEVFGHLKAQYPATYKRLVQIYHHTRINKLPLADLGLSRPDLELLSSKGYSAAAEIALKQNPDYDLSNLYA